MQAKDIKARTWYATKEKYVYPDAVILPGTQHYTIKGQFAFHGNTDGREIFADNNRPMGRGNRWGSLSTGYLAVKLYGEAVKTVQNWILHHDGEEAAHAIMTEAATLLTKVVDAITTRGTVPMAEIDQPENRERGIGVILIEGRRIVGDYAELIRTKYTQEQESKRLREAADEATEQRRQYLVGVINQAREMGLNTDPSKGGARDAYSSYVRYSEIRMSVGAYQELVEEIARLRRVVAGTLRADEVGEGGGDA